MRGATSVIAAAFPVLDAGALAVILVLVVATTIATVPRCCRCAARRSCHHHCCFWPSPQYQVVATALPSLATPPSLLSSQLSLPRCPRSCRYCCRRVAPTLALAVVASAAVSATQPPSLLPLTPQHPIVAAVLPPL